MVFSEWALPIGGFQLGVCDVTARQFEALATSQEKRLEDQRGMLDESSSAADWFRTIEGSMSSLETVLSVSAFVFRFRVASTFSLFLSLFPPLPFHHS